VNMDSHYRPQREPLVLPGQIDCHAADMTATIAADLSLAAAQAALEKVDQWIPIDGDPSFPVGRLVDENSTGPLRLGYGAWRDLLLGCQFTMPDGRLITAGGRTMKNVAGYDLVKLMVGQRGTFGSLLNITVRTYKRPPCALLAEFESDRWLGEILATPLRPRYAILQNDALSCGWLDDSKAIDLFERLASGHRPRKIIRRSLEEDIRHRGCAWVASGRYFRASVPPTCILRFAADAGLKDWIADAAFGIIIGRYSEDEVPIIERVADLCGGSATFFDPDRPPKWPRNSVEVGVLTAIRNAFVPAG
jgi:hypothetical protein